MDRHQHNAHRAGLVAPALPPAPAAGLAPLGTAAAAPASLNPPGKDEAPGWQAEGFKEQGRQDSADCAVQQPGDQPGADDGARFATLAARLALAGWALSRTDAGDGPVTYYATRWGMATPELASLVAVAAFADRVGAPA